MRALVTGANGFLGSHLIDLLIEKGDMEIRAMVRKTSNLRYLEGLPIEKVFGDVTMPVEELGPIIDGVDVVFHLAGLTKALTRRDFYEVNERGTENLVQACLRRTTPPSRFVFISSADAQGPSRTPDPLHEKMEPHPITVYGRSKRSAEKLVTSYQNQLSVTILRPSGIYGPRDLEMLPVFKVARRGFAAKIGFSEGRYNFCHARDAAQAIVLGGKVPTASSETFLVGGANTTQIEMARTIALAFGKKRLWTLPLPRSVLWVSSVFSSWIGKLTRQPRIFCFGNIGRFLAKNWTLDQSKAQRLLGYHPVYDLKTGIEETVEWYREHHYL